MAVSNQIHYAKMNTFLQTATFAEWLGALGDQKGKASCQVGQLRRLAISLWRRQ